ncbi:hypothetical protein COOONC_01474 [Cooperia oncophora]
MFHDAVLVSSECAAYHEIITDSDYETLVDDCAGKRVLAFGQDSSNEFHARMMTEEMFNDLFSNARNISFHIFVLNTEFRHLQLPKLEYLNGGLTIRNNAQLKSFRIHRKYRFDRSEAGPETVTVDGNPMLDEKSMGDLRYLCPYCDIFEWTKCSALDPAEFRDYNSLVEKCAGEKIIKVKPMSSMTLHANKLSEEQFERLFAEATHTRTASVSLTELMKPRISKKVHFFPSTRRTAVLEENRTEVLEECTALQQDLERECQEEMNHRNREAAIRSTNKQNNALINAGS